MSEDRAFLAHFISEEIYVIADENKSVEHASDAAEETPIPSSAKPLPSPSQTSIDSIEVKEPEPVSLKPIHTHGENLKHCIVMFSAEHKLDPNSKDLLFKILGAIDRKPKDVLMANVYGCSDASIEALINENNHKQLISFGVNQPALLSTAEAYIPITEKGKHYILSDHLEDVAVDNTKKRALWGALKSIFKQ